MKKTRTILLRVTDTQYDRIKNNAQAKGYLSLSGYLRFIALDKDLLFEQKFFEMYHVIMKDRKQ